MIQTLITARRFSRKITQPNAVPLRRPSNLALRSLLFKLSPHKLKGLAMGNGEQSSGGSFARKQELIQLTQNILDHIGAGDFEKYSALCDPSFSAFEPESLGHLVTGLDFHKFYFDNDLWRCYKDVRSTMVNPHVHLLGEEAAVVTYARVIQFADKTGGVFSKQYEETRVWHKQNGRWVMVHFHRSGGRICSNAT